jgi:hypothetical protein
LFLLKCGRPSFTPTCNNRRNDISV